MKLSRKDYITILRFYKISISDNAKLNEVREKAEQLIAEKLCRCIKKVKLDSDSNESRAIAICNKSILGKKKLKIHRFTCKKKPKLLGKKGSKTKLVKIY